MTTTEGVFIAGERIITGDCSGPQSARAVLLHPRVEVAVLETARGGILREGLAFDSCSVAVVTNISRDHMGLAGIQTLEELARVKQVVVESVRSDGVTVLNADDPLVAEMAAASDAPVIYFSACPSNHVVVAHLAAGGRCALLHEGQIILAQGDRTIELLEIERVAFTHAGAVSFQVQNALAGAAAAWGAGLNPALIARALTTFATSTELVPGRFNVADVDGVQVILDYGHNPAALRALGQALEALGQRRTILAIGLPGDRGDDDLRATIAQTLPFADEYVLYDLRDLRGRQPGEVPQLLRPLIPADCPCSLLQDQIAALEHAWGRAQPGERLVLIVDEVDEAIHALEQLELQLSADPPCETPAATAEAAVGVRPIRRRSG